MAKIIVMRSEGATTAQNRAKPVKSNKPRGAQPVLVALAFFLLAGLPAHGETLLRPSAFYPLNVGNSWRYRTNTNAPVTVRVVRHETINDVECARLEATQGNTTTVEYLTTLKDGLFRYQAKDKQIVPPLRLLKFPVKKATNWEVKSTIKGMEIVGKFEIGEEEVIVPKGKYKAVTAFCKNFRLGNRDMHIKYWFAPKVGMVKQTVAFAGVEIVLELEEFKIAP